MVFVSDIAPPEIPLQNSVATFLQSPFLTDPSLQNKRYFVDALTGQNFTIGEFRKLVPRVAAILRDAYGIAKNDVVAVFGVNHIFIPVVHFATLSLGAAVSPANIVYSPEELSHQLKMVKPKLLIALDSAKEVALKGISLCEDVATQVVTFSEVFPKFAAALAAPEAPEVHPVSVDPKTHIAYLCFSSGTSGLPKAVVTTHYNIIGNTLQTSATKTTLAAAEPAQCGLLPMSHIYALNISIWSGPYNGRTTVVFPKFELEVFVSKVIEYKTETLFLVPPIVLLLGKTDILDRYPEFKTTVKSIVSAAAPISKETIQLLNRKAPGIKIVQAYGLTETSPVVTCGFHQNPAKQDHYDQESIGWLIPGAEARLVDPGTNKDVTKANERGELWIRGPMVMAGYFKNAEATNDVIEEGGWFKTGDVAIVDDHQQFYIVDRIKELIKSNGHQVAPAELESILLSNPSVLDAAVIGVYNEDKSSEMPRAYVVLKSGADVTEVIQWFNRRVAKHKKLWGGAVVIDVIPKSATGKILRRELRVRQGDKAVGMNLAFATNL